MAGNDVRSSYSGATTACGSTTPRSSSKPATRAEVPLLRRRRGAARRASPRPRRRPARAPRGRGAGTGRTRATTVNGTRSAPSSVSSTPLAAKKSAVGGALSPHDAGRMRPVISAAEVHPLVRERRRALLGGGRRRARAGGRSRPCPPRRAARPRCRARCCCAPSPAASRAAWCASRSGPRTAGCAGPRRDASIRSRRAIAGAWKLQPIASLKPAPTSASPARRRSCCSRVSPARAPWPGIVAGSFSSPHSRATSSIRSTSRVTSLRRKAGTVTSRPSPPSTHAELEPLQQLGLLAERDLGAEQAGDLLVAQPQRASAPDPARRRRPCPDQSVAPLSSSISCAASAWPSHRLISGARPFSKRPDASVRSAEPLRGALEVRAVPVGRLHQHARGVSAAPRSAGRP